MPIRVAEGFVARILKDPAGIVVSVRAVPDLAGEALRRARDDLVRLEDDDPSTRPHLGAQVYGVRYLPDGALVVLDGKSVPDAALLRIPAVVTHHLDAVGVQDAVIGEVVPTEGPHLRVGLGYLRRALHGRLIASPPGRRTPMPSDWSDAALQWLQHDLADDHALWSQSGQAVSILAACDLLAAMLEARQRKTDCFFVAGRNAEWPPEDEYPPAPWSPDQVQADAEERLGKRFRSAWLSFAGHASPTQIVLSEGGPDVGDAAIDSSFQQLRTLIRQSAAQLAYGYVAVEPGFRMDGAPVTEWEASGRGLGTHLMFHACDEFVFDAYPYQVIGPRHLARLGSMPEGAEQLPGGRLGITIGTIDDWLLQPLDPPDWNRPFGQTRNPGVRQRGWDLLRPCLLTSSDRAVHPEPEPKDQKSEQ